MINDTRKETNLQYVIDWFQSHGGTDTSYLSSHYKRFLYTANFIKSSCPAGSHILDIGCHWLHQAYFLIQNGYKVTGADAPNTLRHSATKAIADELSIELIQYTRLDLAQGLKDIPDESLDAILMAEIIEHLAFNPLVMWKEIYRTLKPNGKIFISTPNSVYYNSVIHNLIELQNAACFGIPVREIFMAGTYGHHWKEFSLPELNYYFNEISKDFSVTKSEVVTHDRDVFEEIIYCSKLIENSKSKIPFFDINSTINHLEHKGCQPFGRQIYIEVTLRSKDTGIEKNPPWLVE
jgi:2-polyprenyl-6-hydroxyphenyl methylase/3-demethylubiquinone-9 3-methyltransferase